MELKDQVQGVVIGLFGAYAGGYFADLTSQAETGNPVALVEGLVNLQTPLLGVNLSDDAAWVDTILGHLGVSSTSAAYTAAAAWANGELDAGASRAEVVLAAVTYLLGDSVEAQYASVATAFKADVAAGVVYSEGEGAEVLAIGDLREAAGNPATGTSFNLTAALAELQAAEKAVADFLKEFGDYNEDEDTDEMDVADALTDALAAFNGNDFSTVDYATDASKAKNDAAIALAQANAADAVKAAQDAFKALNDKVKANKDFMQAYTAYKAADAAFAAADKAAKATDDALSDAEAVFENRQVPVTVDNTFAVVDGKLVPNTGSVTVTGSDPVEFIIRWDADKKAFVVDAAIVTAATVKGGQTDNEFAESKALLADANNLLKAFAADYAAQVAAQSASVALDTAETNLAAFDAFASGLDLGAALDTGLEIADKLIELEEAVAEALEAQADLAEIIAELFAAIEAQDTLDALNKVVDAVIEKIEAAGFAVEVLDAPTENASGGNDVFVFTENTGNTTINLFGVSGSDAIFFGQGYTLVELTGTQTINQNVGDASKLEIFWKQDGVNLNLYVETETFGGNSTSDAEIVTVTLAGFNAANIESFANGYLVA